ncbi:MAG: hypothetical protein ACPGN3_03215 [Opitutales bacterium]
MNATTASFSKLHTINQLFSAASGTDAYQAEQISAALRYAQNQDNPFKRNAKPFDEEVRELIQMHLDQKSDTHGVAVWDLREHDYDPLWIRYQIVNQLRRIAGYPEASLIVVGLRNSICPKGKYFTESRKQRYQQAVEYIENLALNYCTQRTKLNLLFV